MSLNALTLLGVLCEREKWVEIVFCMLLTVLSVGKSVSRNFPSTISFLFCMTEQLKHIIHYIHIKYTITNTSCCTFIPVCFNKAVI